MSSDQPNVLLIMDDEHNYRCQGHVNDGEPVQTPAIDRLANTGASFDRAYCASPLCSPSRMTMLTGKRVPNCGAWDNWDVIKPEDPTIAHQLRDAGYETSLVGKMHFGGNRQFNGFNHRPFGDLTGTSGHQPDPILPENQSGVVEPYWSGVSGRSRILDAGATDTPESLHQERRVIDESVSFLREHDAENPDQPWFLTASFGRPHFPITAPQRYIDRYWPDGATEPRYDADGNAADHPYNETRRRLKASVSSEGITEEDVLKARAAYFATVDYVNDLIDDFLSTLERDGLLENTIVVFCSDHGDMIGEQEQWWKRTFYEDSARIPFIISLPEHRNGELEGSNIETPVSLIDLYPTLCSLCGAEVPADIDGIDLSEAMLTGTEPDRDPVIVDWLSTPPADSGISLQDEEFPEGFEYRMVCDGDHKYVQFRDAPELFFNLAEDPAEHHNLIAAFEDRTEADEVALERLRSIVNETIEWDEMLEERAADKDKASRSYRLMVPTGSSYLTNAYHLENGEVINADSLMSSPEKLITQPELMYDDYPDATESE